MSFLFSVFNNDASRLREAIENGRVAEFTRIVHQNESILGSYIAVRKFLFAVDKKIVLTLIHTGGVYF